MNPCSTLNAFGSPSLDGPAHLTPLFTSPLIEKIMKNEKAEARACIKGAMLKSEIRNKWESFSSLRGMY